MQDGEKDRPPTPPVSSHPCSSPFSGLPRSHPLPLLFRPAPFPPFPARASARARARASVSLASRATDPRGSLGGSSSFVAPPLAGSPPGGLARGMELGGAAFGRARTFFRRAPRSRRRSLGGRHAGGLGAARGGRRRPRGALFRRSHGASARRRNARRAAARPRRASDEAPRAFFPRAAGAEIVRDGHAIARDAAGNPRPISGEPVARGGTGGVPPKGREGGKGKGAGCGENGPFGPRGGGGFARRRRWLFQRCWVTELHGGELGAPGRDQMPGLVATSRQRKKGGQRVRGKAQKRSRGVQPLEDGDWGKSRRGASDERTKGGERERGAKDEGEDFEGARSVPDATRGYAERAVRNPCVRADACRCVPLVCSRPRSRFRRLVSYGGTSSTLPLSLSCARRSLAHRAASSRVSASFS